MKRKLLIISLLAMLLSAVAEGQKSNKQGEPRTPPPEQTQTPQPEPKTLDLGDIRNVGSAYRDLKEGESRLRGELQRIDCSGKQIVLTLVHDSQTRHFFARTLRQIEFISYVQGIGREVTCGARKPPDSVVLTFRVTTDKRSDGQVVAVEFVPKKSD